MAHFFKKKYQPVKPGPNESGLFGELLLSNVSSFLRQLSATVPLAPGQCDQMLMFSKKYLWGNQDFPKIKKLKFFASKFEFAQKCYNNTIFK